MAEIQRGVVKWFNDAKGFGFIEHESGRDVFVHYSVIESEGFKTLKDGEEVDYELKEGEKGLHAARVVRVNVAVKRSDKDAGESLSAPNLQSGSVVTATKTTADMIEVEKQPLAESQVVMTQLGEEDSSTANRHS